MRNLWNIVQGLFTHPLNKEQPSQALFRFARWQIVSRISRRDHIHSWLDGTRFFVCKGETGLTGNIYSGLHEFQDMGFLLHAMRSEDFFVDVGANSGSYTILMGGAVKATCISIEPLPSAFKRLNANITLNGIDALVDAKQLGVADRPGLLRFTSHLDTANHVVAEGVDCDGAIEVPVTTLDELVTCNKATFLKLDVEGLEKQVLDGAAKTLGSRYLRAVIMEMNESGSRYGTDEETLLAVLSSYGFLPFEYCPFARKLSRVDRTSSLSANTIFIKDQKWVEERIAASRSFNILGREI